MLFFGKHGRRATSREHNCCLLYAFTFQNNASTERAVDKMACYHSTCFWVLHSPPNAYISRIAINNFATRSLILQRFFLNYVLFFGNGFIITSLMFFGRDMSKVIMNSFPKKKKTPNGERTSAVQMI
jgi:hypothetical protein